MEAKDGSFGFDLEAIYDEVSDLEVLSYIMTDGRRVKTVFEPQSRSTKVTTTFDAEQENPVEVQREGWQAILDNFSRYVQAYNGRAEGAAK